VATNELSDEERQILWEQFGDVHARSQQAYDDAVRTLAAAGVAVTVSIAAAIGGLGETGSAAVFAFLGSLVLNFLSYATVQFDMRTRQDVVRRGVREGIDGNRWTVGTTVLNALAGAAFIAGGALLSVFVGTSA
jgi:hypothetical protein